MQFNQSEILDCNQDKEDNKLNNNQHEEYSNAEKTEENKNFNNNDSKNKIYCDQREHSSTDLEGKILDISEICGKERLTKKEILAKISFDTTQHDIYHPDFSSWDFEALEK